jgi:hypothetical protein
MTFPIVLLIAGLGLIVLGVLETIKIKDTEASANNKLKRVAMFALGIPLVIAAFVLYVWDRQFPPNNADLVAVSTPPTSSIHGTPTPLAKPLTTPNLPQPELLIEIIKREQHDSVRESYGELRGQNFSDDDFASFMKQRKIASITERLRTGGEFLDVVLAIKRMPAADRQKLLDQGSNTYKQTWAELGKVDKTGQTTAGQKAERMIAEVIVNLVKDLSKLSDEGIRKLQTA